MATITYQSTGSSITTNPSPYVPSNSLNVMVITGTSNTVNFDVTGSTVGFLNYIVVGGGGTGNTTNAGGGGAISTGHYELPPSSTTYTFIVNVGAAGAASDIHCTNGPSGANPQASEITATAGANGTASAGAGYPVSAGDNASQGNAGSGNFAVVPGLTKTGGSNSVFNIPGVSGVFGADGSTSAGAAVAPDTNYGAGGNKVASSTQNGNPGVVILYWVNNMNTYYNIKDKSDKGLQELYQLSGTHADNSSQQFQATMVAGTIFTALASGLIYYVFSEL